MEKISFVGLQSGRKIRHGYVDVIGGYNFCIIPTKSENKVYFGIPSVDEDFLQVYAADGCDEQSIKDGIEHIEKTNPAAWVDSYAQRMLEKVATKKIKPCKDFVETLKKDGECYEQT